MTAGGLLCTGDLGHATAFSRRVQAEEVVKLVDRGWSFLGAVIDQERAVTVRVVLVSKSGLAVKYIFADGSSHRIYKRDNYKQRIDGEDDFSAYVLSHAPGGAANG